DMYSPEQNLPFYLLHFTLLNLFYSIERRKVKYARVTVYPDQSVKFVIPLRFSERNLQIFIKEQDEWVKKKLATYAKPREKFIELRSGEILLFGEAFTPGFLTTDKKATEQFYRRTSREYFTKRTKDLAGEFGFTY